MKIALVIPLIWISTAIAPVSLQEGTYDPTSVYKRESFQGFTILINPEVLRHEKEAAEMRKELESQLRAIIHVVPEKPLSALRRVWIWVEWEKKKDGAAEFHPSADWLKQHGYNPEKSGHIELSNTRHFVEWSRDAQPWMLMHEFAHAYHQLVLGENHKVIENAYKDAMDHKLYESVPYHDGSKRKAYAATNAKEYFAELSEAYFGKNDFYPFTRDDLKKHDRLGYQLLENVWRASGDQ
jgi:hypothetical protein